MKPDDLERQIGRQPLREIPPGWREPILKAARQAALRSCPARPDRLAPWWRAVLALLDRRPSALLWPSPTAWAALAAAWIGILAAQLAMREPAPAAPAREASVPARALLLARLEQQRLLARWSEPFESPALAPTKPAPPKPRSEARRRIGFA